MPWMVKGIFGITCCNQCNISMANGITVALNYNRDGVAYRFFESRKSDLALGES